MFNPKVYKQAIESESAYLKLSKEYVQYTNDKEFTTPFVAQVGETLGDRKEKGIHKYYALKLLTDSVQTYKGAVINNLANYKEMFVALKNFALFDKGSQSDDRGSQIFEDTDGRIGNQFLRLVLESIYSWGEKFKKDSKGMPTRFRVLLDDLLEQNVKFPSVFQFYPQPPQMKELPPPPIQPPQQRQPAYQESVKPETQINKSQIDQKQLRGQFNKLFATILEDAQSIEETIKEALEPEEFIQDILESYSKTFCENQKTAEKLRVQLLDPDSGFSKGEKNKFEQIYEFIQIFILQFKELSQSGFMDTQYKQFHELILYQCAIIMGKALPKKPFQPIQPVEQAKPIQKPVQETPKAYQPQLYDNYQKPTEQKLYDNQPKPTEQNKQLDKQTMSFGGRDKSIAEQLVGSKYKQEEISYKKPDQQPAPYQQQNQSEARPKPSYQALLNNQLSQAPTTLTSQQRPQLSTSRPPPTTQKPQEHPVVPISVQAQMARKNMPPINEFAEKFDALSMSTMSVRDFPMKNKPLDNVKHYFGQLVPYDGSQFNSFYDMGLNDNQIRRLKVATLKQKASVFESPQVQVGVISKLCYHEMTSRYFLKLTLVVGNKSKSDMLNCTIEYEGDYGLSLWTQPIKVNSIKPKGLVDIEPKNQLSQDMMIHYNSVPFQVIGGVLDWQDEQYHSKANFMLPTLLPKFMKFTDVESRVFRQRWHIKRSNLLKSEIVPFNPKIIRQPIFFKRYFPELVELSSLSDFVNQQEYNDFKLGGVFCLQNPKIEFMLKIIVRPNLSGLFKIIPFSSQQSQAEHILHNLVYIFGLPN